MMIMDLRKARARRVALGTRFLLFFVFAGSVVGQTLSSDRKTFTTSDQYGTAINKIVRTPMGDKGIEVKEVDKKGKVTQWYQSFLDASGREIIYICRVVPGVDKPPYEGIQLITTYTYNRDNNVSEEFQFSGDGCLLRHIIYKYDANGKWVGGDEYGPTGKHQAVVATPPEYHLYGTK